MLGDTVGLHTVALRHRGEKLQTGTDLAHATVRRIDRHKVIHHLGHIIAGIIAAVRKLPQLVSHVLQRIPFDEKLTAGRQPINLISIQYPQDPRLGHAPHLLAYIPQSRALNQRLQILQLVFHDKTFLCIVP